MRDENHKMCLGHERLERIFASEGQMLRKEGRRVEDKHDNGNIAQSHRTPNINIAEA